MYLFAKEWSLSFSIASQMLGEESFFLAIQLKINMHKISFPQKLKWKFFTEKINVLVLKLNLRFFLCRVEIDSVIFFFGNKYDNYQSSFI